MAGADVTRVAGATDEPFWRSDPIYWWNCLAKQEAGERVVLIACLEGEVAGYAYLSWRSQNPRFAAADIPEIGDLRVAVRLQRRGIASAIIAECERLVLAEGRSRIGLGVGLYAGYGQAQRLYHRLGYRPDGHGVSYQNQDAKPGAMVRLDDELLLWLVKDLA
jgi:GNAT superfamily N-acetyltransferase